MHAMLLVKPQPVNEDLTDPRWQLFQEPERSKISVNVLGVCDMEMQFVYVLTGWEGSVADSRVLRDAINRQNGLKVPIGNYYLCDNGYANCEGFLTPYKGVRYHLNEWTSRSPQTPQEYFNMKHTKEMVFDPLEVGVDNYLSNQPVEGSDNNTEVISSLDTTPEWTSHRDNMALHMFNEWTNNITV
ncbi:hypothetical protein ACS0TY_004364 [Phlomoides rotata]